MIGALRRVESDTDGVVVVTAVDAAELSQRFAANTGAGELVTRSGQRLSFDSYETHGGLVTVRVTVSAAEIVGGRIELQIRSPQAL